MHEASTPYKHTPRAPSRTVVRVSVRGLCHDAQTDMLPGEPESAICVQRFDDSLSSAIHITYRSWLRSSSMHEPRDPPLEVVSYFASLLDQLSKESVSQCQEESFQVYWRTQKSSM